MNDVGPRMLSADSILSTTELRHNCTLIARGLLDRGFEPGDRVGLVGANSPEFVLTLLTLMHLDASIVLLDNGKTAEEQAAALAQASARWVVCDDEVEVNGSGDLRRVSLKELVSVADTEHGNAVDLDFSRWYDREDALIVWSSGTTGSPTGVVRSGVSVRDNINRTQRRMGYTADDVLLPLLPFSHQYGLSLVLLWWFAGARLVLVPHTRLDRVLEAISELKVTVVDAAPSTYHSLLRIMERRRISAEMLDSVRMWCVGGAPLGSSLATNFSSKLGKPLLDGYGSSEAGNIALASADNPVLSGQPLDGIEIDIVDEQGRVLEPGKIGELVVRTPDLMVGVLTSEGSVEYVDRSVYRPGDIGYRDEDGNIAVLGRQGAVHRHGHTIFPEALAHKAEACGAPVQVVPIEDERRGCQLVFVVADTLKRDSRLWRRIFSEQLAAHERPNKVIVVSAFPLNNNGKVDRKALRELVRETVEIPGSNAVTTVLTEHTRDLSTVPFPERLSALRAVERCLRHRRDEVLAILTEVSNYKTAVGELETSIQTLRGALDEICTYRPPAIGTTAVFMPSNIPLYAYVLYLLIPSLYSQSVVARPSSHISSQSIRLHELLASEHKLPIDVSSSTQREFVSGPVSKSELVIFTGTYANAEKIRTQLSDEQLFLYFGQGINPLIIAPGADVDLAVADTVEIRLLNSGQDCFGPDAIFVHESLADRFFTLLNKQLDELLFGDNTDPRADYGPMYYEQAFGFALEYLRRNAEHIVYGGQANIAIRYLQPTVLARKIGGKLNCEELFAPIFNVICYRDQQDLHNVLTSPFFEERAMGAMVYGDQPETVELLGRRHEVCVNTTLLHTDNGNAPFGGRGMIANYAAFQGQRSAEPLLASKAVADYLTPVLETRRRSA